MKISKVIADSFSKNSGIDFSTISTDFLKQLGSNPLPGLIQAAKQYKSFIESRSPSLDALACGFSNLYDCFYDAADQLLQGNNLPIDNVIDITEDDISPFLAGISQSIEAVNTTTQPTQYFTGETSFTSASGLYYRISTEYKNGKYEVSNIVNGVKTAFISYNPIKSKYEMHSNMQAVNYLDPNTYNLNTVFGILKAFYALQWLEQPATTIQACIEQILDKYSIEYQGTLLGGIRQIATRLAISYSQSDGIFDIATKMSENFGLLLRQGYTEHAASIGAGLIASSDINAKICEVIDSISSGKIASYVSSLSVEIQDKSKAVRKFLQGLQSSYISGGLRAAIMYVLRFGSSMNNIKSENGTFTFTDNAAFRPKEFIAGMVSSITNLVSQAVSLIVSIFKPVVGLILSAITTAVYGVYQSFAGVKDDVYASVDSEITEANAHLLTPFLPVATAQWTIPVTKDLNNHPIPIASFLPWYSKYYLGGHPVVQVLVTGGCIILGPGSYDEWDDELNQHHTEISELLFEFHPSSVACKWHENEHWNSAIVNIDMAYSGVTSDERRRRSRINLSSLAKQCAQEKELSTVHANELCEFIKEIYDDAIQNNAVAINNTSTGHLSIDDDYLLRKSSFMHTWVFIMQMILQFDEVTVIPHADGSLTTLGTLTFSSPNSASYVPNEVVRIDCIAALACGGNLSSNVSSTWNSLISTLNYFNHESNSVMIQTANVSQRPPEYFWWIVGSSTQVDDLITGTVTTKVLMPTQLCLFDSFIARISLGIPLQVSDGLSWYIIMPSYDSSSFYKWLAIAVISLVAVTAVTIAATVGLRNWRKNTAARNTAKNNVLRERYQKSISGIQEITDENGNPIRDPDDGSIKTKYVDPASTEGKAYSAKCFKEYRTNCFTSNMMANIVGGSKFDVTTYYGDAVSDDSSSSDATDADLNEGFIGLLPEDYLNTLFNESGLSGVTSNSISTLQKALGIEIA